MPNYSLHPNYRGASVPLQHFNNYLSVSWFARCMQLVNYFGNCRVYVHEGQYMRILKLLQVL